MDSVFESVFSGIDAFVYRCRNDKNFTMQHMSGGVERILGYHASDLIDNARVTYVGLTVEDDQARVNEEVDAAIEAGKAWDIAYRMTHKGGQTVWVRERGSAIYEDGNLAQLQGLVVGADAEFGLRTQLEQQVADVRGASSDVMGLTEQITSSVREMSMLSINARIEAARSGEIGKGFAVVANEIKALADRNAGLASQIADHVGSMNVEVK